MTALPLQPVISLTEEAAEAQGVKSLADSHTVIKNDRPESRLCDTPTTCQQPPLVSPRLVSPRLVSPHHHIPSLIIPRALDFGSLLPGRA